MATAVRTLPWGHGARGIKLGVGRTRPGNTDGKKANIAFSINGQIKPSNRNKFSLMALYHNARIIDLKININNTSQVNFNYPAIFSILDDWDRQKSYQKVDYMDMPKAHILVNLSSDYYF